MQNSESDLTKEPGEEAKTVESEENANKENIDNEKIEEKKISQENLEPKPQKNQQNEEPPPKHKPAFTASYEEGILLRKKESFNNFQSWENKRRDTIQNNKSLLNNMLTRIDKKIEWMDSGMDNIIKFFKGRMAQEESFSKILTNDLPQLGTTFTHSTHPEIFANFAKTMGECDDYHKRQSQNSLALAKFLSVTILESTLLNFEKFFKQKLEKLKEPVNDVRKKLSSTNQDVAKKQAKYLKLYEETIVKGIKNSTKDKDLYKQELDCVIASSEEIVQLKNYAREGINYITELKKLLETRFQAAQKAMTLYFQKVNDLHGRAPNNTDTILRSLAELKCSVDIDDYFSIQKTFSLEEIQYIQNVLKKMNPELSFTDVEYALTEKLKIPPPDKKPLIMKEWTACRESGIMRNWKPFSVICTGDANILLVERNEEGQLTKVDSILKLHLIKIQKLDERKERNIIEVTETTPGIFLDSKTRVTLKFDNEDMAEEFLHYVFNFYNSIIVPVKK